MALIANSRRPSHFFPTKIVFSSLRRLCAVLIVAAVAACGTTAISYSPKPIETGAAQQNIERLVMTQHPAWRPDNFIFADDFFGWSFGTVSRGSASGAVIGGAVFANSSESVRQVSDRVYYAQVAEVRLYSWKRKFRQWYLVSLVDRDGRIAMHALRTLSQEDAELMVDSLDQFIYAKTGRHPVVR